MVRGFVILVALTSLACTQANPAFDGLGEGSESSSTESDPTLGSGDGDGDPSTGDGDGEPPTGDGDPSTGDGDGDPDTGDGDGDGDPDTGDGDGDPNTGDGDGDPIEELCDPGEWVEDKFHFLTSSLGQVDMGPAPGFADAPYQCHLFVICPADQDECHDESPYILKGHSNGDVFAGNGGNIEPGPIQLVFWPGPMPCGEPLELDPSQYLAIDYWDGMWKVLKIRLPCYDEYGLPLYVATDGSTFWDLDFAEPAALAPG